MGTVMERIMLMMDIAIELSEYAVCLRNYTCFVMFLCVFVCAACCQKAATSWRSRTFQ